MSRRPMFHLAAHATAAVLAVSLAGAALAGGQWIEVRVAEPAKSANSGAPTLLVQSYNCGVSCRAPLVGRAEGLVNARRRTIPLRLEPAGKTGVYAVERQWPAEGAWVLVFTWKDHEHASVLVELGPGGRLPAERGAEPRGKAAAKDALRVAYGPVSASDIQTALAAVVAQ